MDFQKLVELVNEAKGTRPGDIYKRVGEREGPAGMTTMGRPDNFEKRTKLNRWEFDPSIGKDIGAAEGSKMWRNMLNSFGLLMNYKDFEKDFNRISDGFKKKLDGYRNIKYNDEGEIVNNDEEKNLDRLEKNRSNYEGKITDLNQRIADIQTVINRTKWKPYQRKKVAEEIGALKGKAGTVKKQIREAKNEKERKKEQAKYDAIWERIQDLQNRLDQANTKEEDVVKLRGKAHELAEKKKEWEKKLEKTIQELEELYNRINQINEHNKLANKQAVNGVIGLIQYAAQTLLKEYSDKLKNPTDLKDLSQLDWEQTPQALEEKISMLEALASEDPDVNPIVGYLNLFQTQFENTHTSMAHNLDKNSNITVMREINRLPFMILGKIFANIKLSKIPMESVVDMQTHLNAYNNFKDYIRSFDKKAQDAPTMRAWASEEVKETLRSFVDNFALPKGAKDLLIDMINSAWRRSASGLNSFGQLEQSVESDLKKINTQKESFDKTFSNIILERTYDDDDFKLDLMEVLSYRKS